MLGPNPRRAGVGTATPIQGNGLMVKAIDEIFRHVEESEKPEAFRVSEKFISERKIEWSTLSQMAA